MKTLASFAAMLVLVPACAAPMRGPATPGQPAPTPTPAAPVAAQPQQFTVVPLQYASADELATTLSRLLDRTKTIRVIPDTRTNSLVITAADDRELSTVRELIARLDVQVPAK